MDAKKNPTVSKTLIVKAVGFKSGRRKDWNAPRLDDALRQVLKNAPLLGDRHHPIQSKIGKGSQCLFINRAQDFGTGGVLFEMCSYVHGHVPESMTPDLNLVEADIRAIELKDDEGKVGELVHSMRCLALGQIVMMESVRGFGGATAALQRLLTYMFRRHLGDTSHPSVDLGDIGSSDLRRLIASRGGVSKVSAKITSASETAGTKYGGMLSETLGGVSGAKNCSVTWESPDGVVDTDDAVGLLEESDDNSLAGVTLWFKYGGSVSDLAKYRERKAVYVQTQSDGRPLVSAIENALRDYLDDLRAAAIDGAGPITTDGTLVNSKIVTSG